jgi:cation diffusion facilitator CzcD-associated flavoprotein CzcO
MGLCTARQLSKHQIPFQGFELYQDVGGLWDIDNPHSTMYESAHLISSKSMTELSEFPLGDDVAVYPHHSEICQYFRDYADRFQLRDHFHFGARVTACTPLADGRWQLRWEQDEQTKTAEFAGVLIANGQLSEPNRPTFPGQFNGQILHSCQYKSPDLFAGRRVLIVGCGNSACDIAVDAVHRATSVSLSVRRGYYFIPKFVMGKPVDTIGGRIRLPRRLKQFVDGLLVKLLIGTPSDYGLPDPDYRLYESHPVVSSLVLHHIGHGDIQVRKPLTRLAGDEVEFSDGVREPCDLIMLATGYKLNFPFIDRELLNWQGAAPSFYLNVFHPQRDDLFLMGMIEAAGLGWQARMEQAELVALYILAKQSRPSALRRLNRDIRQNHAMTGGMRYLKVDRMAYYVHKETYRKQMARHRKQLRRELGMQ